MTRYLPLGRLACLTFALLLFFLPGLAGTPTAPAAQAAPPPVVPLDSALRAAAEANNLPVALLIPLPRLPIQANLTWSGAGGDGLWSNPANWAEGRSPGPTDQVQIPAGAGDSRIDPGFGGMIAGLRVESGYGGTLRLENTLLVAGTLHLGSGKLEQGRYALHTITLSQPGGELVGGTAPLIVDEAASVGGLLTTPSALMSARSLEIAAGAVVRLGADGKLNLTGDGSPLSGAGLLDVMSHRPNSVELTGKGVSDIALAGPAGQLRAAGLDQLDLAAGLEQAGAAPPPAIPWLKPPVKPMAAFGLSGSLTLAAGEGYLRSAVIDPINNFAYFGMDSFPGRIVKINTDPANFTRVGVITLNPEEDELLSAVIDPANGFAYFGTFTSPGRVVRINITPAGFARSDAITLNTGENGLLVAVIDPDEDVAYFGTATSPAQVVKVNIDPANFARIDAITLNSGENNLRSAVIDPDEDVAYFGTNTTPGRVVKINIDPANFARMDAITLNSGENDLRSAVIDPANNFAYFGTNTSPGRVVKVNIDPANFARTDAITLQGSENQPRAVVIDPANGFAYFGVSTNRLVKVNLDPVNFARAGAINLNSGENVIDSAVIDLANGFAYFGTGAYPGRVVKVNIDPANFARTDAITLLVTELFVQSAVIDPANNFAYFGTYYEGVSDDPGLVVKVNIDPANFARVGVVTLNPGEEWPRTAVIDPANGFAYFTTYASTSQVVKVNITPAGFARVGAITLNPGEGWIQSAVIDPANNLAYFGTYATNPALVIKVNTDPANFARVESIALPAGETGLMSAVIDPANGFAYFGTFTSPGRVVKINIDPAGFARTEAITLNPGENQLRSAVIDLANNFAYFGTDTSGRVIKVNTDPANFARTEAITLNSGETGLRTAVIDPANGFAYFGTYTNPGQVVKVQIDPANFGRVAAVTFNPEEYYPSAAVIDPANGFAYFGLETVPGRVIRLDVSPNPPEMAVLGGGQTISAGDSSPSLADLTDFGGVALGSAITHTFTISNSGDQPLAITSLGLSGAAAGEFTLTGVTTPLTVTARTTTTFQLRFNPAVVGTRVATVTIPNNDSDETPYEFAIQGVGAVCFAEYTGDNTTDFSSADAQAVRDAVAAAPAGGLVKVAGRCAGVSGGQVVNITQALTVQGGYTITNWLAPGDPVANPTVLDALNAGRVINASQPLTVANLTVQNGNISGEGGGINASGDLTLIGVNVLSNRASNNGGGARVNGAATLIGGLFQNNHSANNNGGGLFANSTLTLTNTQFLSNTAWYAGGGVRVNGAATLTGGLFQDNQCASMGSAGGGLYANSTATLSGTQFISNQASNGGGVIALATATLSGTQFISNRAISSGGGLFAINTATLSGTQFISNTAGNHGGGLLHSNGSGRVVNSLFARNSAAANGESMYLESSGNVQLIQTTLASPIQANGAAIHIIKGTVNITNTLIASHTTGIHQAGGTVTENFNLFFGNTANTAGTVGGGIGSFTGNPAFVNPAADDYHLAADSAAIDSGSNTGITTDFEGEARPQGDTFDIGYDESPFTGREIAVLGNGQVIAAGEASPSPADHTDFGSTPVDGGAITRTFTISNSGMTNLVLTGSPVVSITGAAAADFSVVTLPDTPIVPGGTTTFQVRFDPAVTGTRVATVTVANNDNDENPYDFAIQGEGVTPVIQFTQATAYSDLEGVGTSLTVSLSRSGDTSLTSTVQVALTGGTALGGGVDYDDAGFPLTVNFGPGVISQSVSVPLVDDAFDETTETIAFQVTALSNAAIGTVSTATLEIVDNDTAGLVPAGLPLALTEGLSGTYQLRLSSQPTAPVTLSLTTDGQVGVSPASLVFSPATWNQPQTVTVTALADGLVEGSHSGLISHTVTSADPAYAGLAPLVVSLSLEDAAVTPVNSLLYLPLLLQGVNGQPDLIIEQIVASSSALTVTVRNLGSEPVADAFWVDVYFNPTQPPVLNQPWKAIAPKGAVWGVTEPLGPGQRLTLSLGDRFYRADESSLLPFPAGATVYGYVDSINYDTSYGNVREQNEQNNRFGPTTSINGAASLPPLPQAGPPAQALPRR